MTSLKEYQRKRQFEKTPEPSGKRAAAQGNSFVVQKHAATRLHYDFRLELDGVLRSWAVPKGPSLNPADKRLAVQTEDHPLDYGGFEGVIPKGNYGAGTVMVWDNGTFAPEGDLPADQQLAKGDFKFVLRGQKLRGSFVLVKLKRGEKGNEWLLIKHRDAAMDEGWNIDEHGGSVLTGRTMEEISHDLPPADPSSRASELEGARKAKMPAKMAPMLATLVDQPFSDPDWLFEIKLDGVRALAFISDRRLELHARTGRIITSQYPELAVLPERLRARQAILDGEIVALDEHGRSDFERLQQRMNVAQPSPPMQRQVPIVYYLFDLPYCDGYDLRVASLLERKNLLRRLLDPGDPIRYADHQMGKGREIFDLVREQGLEGIVGKDARSPYVNSRSAYWVKFKVVQELDAVIGGWTAPRGSREHFGALLLGLYERKSLRFIGGVGTGFDEKTVRGVYEQVAKRASNRCPFDEVPKTKEKACWIEPRLIARVRYANWTEDRHLRAPAYLGLVNDRDPEECRFENETPAALFEKVKTFGSDSAAASSPPPGAATAPLQKTVGRVLSKASEIEKELLHGRAEKVSVEIDGKHLQLTNLNKVYFPESGYTKRDLLAYYHQMADYLLPFIKDRPLVLRRYPDGITGKSFFQKDAGGAAPEWMETASIYSEENRGNIDYFLANDRASLLYLTNLGCIDHNPWSSRYDDLDHPDYVFFDLDPSEGTEFPAVVAVAKAIFEKLQAARVTVFLKTSGATGFHLYVPLELGYTYEQVRTFAEVVARLVAAKMPKLVTHSHTVKQRPAGTVLIDSSQNAHGRPLAAVYSVRASPKAPTSCPVIPNELRSSLRPDRLNIKTMAARLKKHGDLWADFWQKRQRLEDAIEALSRDL